MHAALLSLPGDDGQALPLSAVPRQRRPLRIGEPLSHGGRSRRGKGRRLLYYCSSKAGSLSLEGGAGTRGESTVVVFVCLQWQMVYSILMTFISGDGSGLVYNVYAYEGRRLFTFTLFAFVRLYKSHALRLFIRRGNGVRCQRSTAYFNRHECNNSYTRFAACK